MAKHALQARLEAFVKDKETKLVPDGTEIPNSIKGNLERNSKNGEGEDGLTKMISLLGTTYQFISAVRFPDNPYDHESSYSESLFEGTAETYSSINHYYGDPAYSWGITVA